MHSTGQNTKAINKRIRPGRRIMLGAVMVDTDIKAFINGRREILPAL